MLSLSKPLIPKSYFPISSDSLFRGSLWQLLFWWLFDPPLISRCCALSFPSQRDKPSLSCYVPAISVSVLSLTLSLSRFKFLCREEASLRHVRVFRVYFFVSDCTPAPIVFSLSFLYSWIDSFSSSSIMIRLCDFRGFIVVFRCLRKEKFSQGHGKCLMRESAQSLVWLRHPETILNTKSFAGAPPILI